MTMCLNRLKDIRYIPISSFPIPECGKKRRRRERRQKRRKRGKKRGM